MHRIRFAPMTSPTSPDFAPSLCAIANHLDARREPILSAWQKLAESDPVLQSASPLSRAQFVDHVPILLEAFGRHLREGDDPARPTLIAFPEARQHGLHRWQQGYDLLEVTREWGLLQACLNDEIEAFRAAQPDIDPQALALAYQSLTRMMSDCLSHSVTQFQRTREAEAMAHLRDIEDAHRELQAIESARIEMLRAASHDLRGGLTVVQTATHLLTRPLAGQKGEQASVLDVLERGVAQLGHMMTDLMDLARLEAGQERVQDSSFDAAVLLRELCASVEPIASGRGLRLQTEGPSSMTVEGDRTKVSRIAQNLLLNALRYTREGSVTFGWQEQSGDQKGTQDEWMMWVRDTGPGLSHQAAAPLAHAMEQATNIEHDALARNAPSSADSSLPSAGKDVPATSPAPLPTEESRGEGIGLTIVKRLSDLMQARVELETDEAGTLFRVFFPRKTKD